MLTRITKLPFTSDVVIIDNEISNDISPLWRTYEGIPHQVGILFKDTLRQYIFDGGDEQQFKRSILRILNELPQPFLALNNDFERGNFLGYLDKEYLINDIRWKKGKGTSKDLMFNEIEDNQIRFRMLLFPNVINGTEIEQAFKDKRFDDILDHNHNCLIKEYAIWLETCRRFKINPDVPQQVDAKW